MRIPGIDPGTVSFDLCLLDGREIAYEESIPSTVVAERPEEFAEKCLGLNLDVMIAPSGMGLNNRRLTEDLGGKQIIFLLLKPFGNDEISKSYARQYMLTPEEHERAVKEIYDSGTSLDIFYDEPFI